MKKKIIIVGGGAAGLMAAGKAAESGASVTVAERRERPARKILVTGKGRCNLTNNCPNDRLIANVPRGGRFLYSAFAGFSAADTMSLFEGMGVPLKTERGNRVFPVSDKAMDIADALADYARGAGARIANERVTSLILEDGAAVGVECESGNKLYADCVIVATGGLSYPATGSSGDGYTLASQAGHTVTSTSASLIPLLSDDDFCRDAQGVSLKNVGIKITEQGRKKPVYEDFGEMLFTHFGVSGPTILSASAHLNDVQSGKYTLHIDLKPALDEQALDARLLRDFGKNVNRDFINSVGELLPRKLIVPIVKRSGIDFHEKINQLTKQERQNFCALLKNIEIHLTGTRPVTEAVITRGGVSLKEIDPRTMESKLCRGLYFAGEVIDADAYTGGFNLQIAFSTGALAGKSAADEE